MAFFNDKNFLIIFFLYDLLNRSGKVFGLAEIITKKEKRIELKWMQVPPPPAWAALRRSELQGYFESGVLLGHWVCTEVK
jgi:hypothetical protein